VLKNNKKLFFLFLLLIIFLILFRVDFRFKTTVECCSDDYDYFLHASTIALDFDLDYDNQNPRAYSYKLNNKNTPIGFFGSGLLSAPFLFFGNQVSKLIGENVDIILLNYRLLFYSISSIFYLFAGYIFIYFSLIRLKLNFNKYFLLLFYISPGIGYFAFERFSMTHSYEAFGLSLIFYTTLRFYQKEDKEILFDFLVPISILLSFLIRMSNLFIFLMPLLIRRLMLYKGFDSNHKLLKSKMFYFSTFVSCLIYSAISKDLYGSIVLNPQRVYGTNITLDSQLVDLSRLLINLITTFTKLLFSFEFGLFWLSPVLFVGILFLVLKVKEFYRIEYLIIFLSFFQNILIVYLWQSTGSSYGFRYLFSLIPLSILIYYIYFSKSKIVTMYLTIFSFLALLSLIFFETTELTQLSTVEIVNTFGRTVRYSQPEYVKGLFQSIINFESYLIIFTTSFMGVLFFKLLLFFLNVGELNSLLEKLSLPVYNEDFQNYLINLENLGLDKVIFILLFLIIISYIVTFKLD